MVQVLPSIDSKKIPEGFEYQWVALAVRGDEKLGDMRRMFDLGWRPVPPERHWDAPECIGFGHAHELRDGQIGWVVGGLLLCERSKILQDRARKEEREKADQQIGRLKTHSIEHRADLPEDNRGIDPDRILPIVSYHALREGVTATWTDNLTIGLWLSGWRYAEAHRYPEYQMFTKDPTKKRVLFFDRGQPRWLIERKGPPTGVRPAFDWYGILRFWRWWRK